MDAGDDGQGEDSSVDCGQVAAQDWEACSHEYGCYSNDLNDCADFAWKRGAKSAKARHDVDGQSADYYEDIAADDCGRDPEGDWKVARQRLGADCRQRKDYKGSYQKKLVCNRV